MSELDIVKQQIAYLTVWLGIMVITDITLVGWFVSSYEIASDILLLLGIAAIAVVSISIRLLHLRIARKIASLREL